MTAARVISLTTDFGVSDAYVGIMKGVILTIEPSAKIVDVSHTIAPQDIMGGARLLASVVRFFPVNAIHVAVVDPGVGTERRPIAVRVGEATLIGPDNGLLVAALAELGAIDLTTGRLIDDALGVQLEAPQFQLHPVSATFHGRDIFSPAAAHLAAGAALKTFGSRLYELILLPLPQPVSVGNSVRGHIVTIDHFGNAISNIAADLVPVDPVVTVKSAMIRGLSNTYQAAEIVALVGSSGYLEVGVRNGSAADHLGIRSGDEISIRAEG